MTALANNHRLWKRIFDSLPRPVVVYLAEWSSHITIGRTLVIFLLTYVLILGMSAAQGYLKAHWYFSADAANIVYTLGLILGTTLTYFQFPIWAKFPRAGVDVGIALGYLVYFW